MDDWTHAKRGGTRRYGLTNSTEDAGVYARGRNLLELQRLVGNAAVSEIVVRTLHNASERREAANGPITRVPSFIEHAERITGLRAVKSADANAVQRCGDHQRPGCSCSAGQQVDRWTMQGVTSRSEAPAMSTVKGLIQRDNGDDDGGSPDGGVDQTDAGAGDASLPGGVETPPPPDGETPMPPRRTIDSVTMKRDNVHVSAGAWGHWWTEIDGTESYGWWPKPKTCKDSAGSLWDWLVGTPGELNVKSCPNLGGSATRDPHHGETAEESFHPVNWNGMSDDQIKNQIRSFAAGYTGDWSSSRDCHDFQNELMQNSQLVQP
jgi:hypothetical protein